MQTISQKPIVLDIKRGEKLSSVVKNSIRKAGTSDITLDLSSMNILEATKIMVLSSTYHYQKFPRGKVKCKLSESQRCNFISPFITKNLELV